jgi:transcriptional regulator with XRE-family HTH domain
MRYRIDLIIRARGLKGLTQADLARAIERDPATISKIEKGLIQGAAPTMKRIADVLEIPMEDLLLEEEVIA